MLPYLQKKSQFTVTCLTLATISYVPQPPHKNTVKRLMMSKVMLMCKISGVACRIKHSTLSKATYLNLHMSLQAVKQFQILHLNVLKIKMSFH